MQKQPKLVDRKMIPRWRTLAYTPAPELYSATRLREPITIVGIGEAEWEWQQDPTPWAAAELLSIAVYTGRSPIADEAAQFLKESEFELAPGVNQLIDSYFIPKEPTEEDGVTNNDRAAEIIYISKLKRISRINPRNPIAHIEIARAQTTLGQTRSAENHVRQAILLAPHNRYILRSAVRFFVHNENLDAAWSVIRDAPNSDPWLLASKIAVGEMFASPQPNSRIVDSLIDRLDPSQTTELSASFATLELGAGKFKRARKLFSMSSTSPTENTVAQIRWAHENTGVPFNSRLLETSRSFEARTGQFIFDKEWDAAADSARLWHLDEPFSRRAADTSCFLLSEILMDFRNAERATDVALISTPKDPGLLNNRAFTRANLGDIKGAKADLEIARSQKPSLSTQLCIRATDGCINYRAGNFSAGEQSYRDAIELANSEKEPAIAQRAFIHWIAEEGRIGRRLDPETSRKIADFFEKDPRVREMDRAIYKIHASKYIDPNPFDAFIADIGRMAAEIMKSAK